MNTRTAKQSKKFPRIHSRKMAVLKIKKFLNQIRLILPGIRINLY